jgi:hypothetical protein
MTKSPTGTLYTERLLPGLPFYLATAFVPVALYLVALAFNADIALLALIVAEIVIIILSILLAPVITLNNEELRVARAYIPTSALGKSLAVSKDQIFVERGQKLDPKAYISFQIGVKGLIKTEIKDANDPTPYWLFSTRHPIKLAEALNQIIS